MLEDYRTMEELLEVERELCDRLDDQISDLSELHGNEIANIKQVHLCTTRSLKSYILQHRDLS